MLRAQDQTSEKSPSCNEVQRWIQSIHSNRFSSGMKFLLNDEFFMLSFSRKFLSVSNFQHFFLSRSLIKKGGKKSSNKTCKYFKCTGVFTRKQNKLQFFRFVNNGMHFMRIHATVIMIRKIYAPLMNKFHFSFFHHFVDTVEWMSTLYHFSEMSCRYVSLSITFNGKI